MLKREEDDLKDAILFFTPDTYSIEDQCALCGQLMGISEFLKATLGKSAPRIFKFEHEKFALKRTGAYTFGLKGGSFIPDSLLNTQLTSLYEIFITYHGSIDSLKLRCKEISGGFLQELDNIWKIILNVSKVFHGYTLSQTFQALPYLQLPKSGTHLFLQASHLLQSSQRRPCVLAGTILYKNRVLCTQLPPKLTSHLTYLQNQIPHIVKKTDCDLPVGCRIVTLFLTDEELSEISSLDSLARHHCKITDFSVCRESENAKKANKASKQLKPVTKRRLTCPNLSVSNSASQKTLRSYLTTGQKGACLAKQESVAVDNFSWSYKSKLSLSHVPIVECKHGESPLETDAEILYERAKHSQFGESYKQVAATANCDNEQSETDSENDNVIDPSNEKVDCDKDIVDSPTVQHAEEKVDSSYSDHDSDVILKANSNGTVDEENRTEENGLCQSKTEIYVEMEGKKSDHFYVSSENKDLCDVSDKKGEAVVTDVSDIEQNLKSPLENKIGQTELTEVKHENEEDPSISDLEDEETEKVQNCAKQINEVFRHTKNEVEHGIENKDTSVEAAVRINDESNLAEIAISNSSSEGVKSRFYDCISDTETKTLKKDSDHSVHQHIVDVHIEDSGVGLESEKIAEKKTGNNGREPHKAESVCKTCGDQTQFESEKNADHGPICLDNVLPGSSLGKSNPAVSGDGVNETVANTEDKQFQRRQSENSPTDINSEDSKENIDPNVSLHQDTLSDTNKYESEIETEDEGLSIAMIAPCINCLELASQHPTHGETLRCGHCIEQFNKRRMFPRSTNDQEIIDFNQRGRERYESGAETDGVADVDREGSGPSGSLLSSLSSDVSTDSHISRYWTQEMDGLNDVTLYVQCHSDISLLLLMENPEHYEESLFHSLWKGSLAQLADLDFYIKECIESAEDDDNNSGNKYLKYDIFAADLKGTIEDSGTDRKSTNFHQMLATLHTEFQQEECLSDAILRSHFNSCYGHSNQVEETYFQADLPQKSSGFPVPKDPVFSLDMLAHQHLANEKHLCLL